MPTKTELVTLQSFLADHAICRVWHTGFDCPTGDEHVYNADDEGVADEDYCGNEELFSILTGWLALDLDDVEGTVSKDSDGEYRWEWNGKGDRRNCRGNSIFQLTVWAD